MRIKRKIGSRAGFTLAETMLAVLILLMVSSIVATGIPVAQNAYEKVIIAANAQVLLSTTVSALRDELGTARNVAIEMIDGITCLTYFGGDTGAKSRIFLKAYPSDGAIKLYRGKDLIYIQEYAGNAYSTSEGSAEHLLISEAAMTNDLYVRYTDVSYDAASGVVTFGGLKVYRASNGSVIADLDGASSNLSIRVFSGE